MKVQLQYLNDHEGNVTAVQIPIEDWEKLEDKIKGLENIYHVKDDLKAAFEEVEKIKAGKIPNQTLSGFLNEIV